MMNPISIYCTLYTPYIHTHMLFSRFYTLLCALVTVHTAYTIYFVLIHHCTNSLSSLHIFVHHCTSCASLHTKTSPEAHHASKHLISRPLDKYRFYKVLFLRMASLLKKEQPFTTAHFRSSLHILCSTAH